MRVGSRGVSGGVSPLGRLRDRRLGGLEPLARLVLGGWRLRLVEAVQRNPLPAVLAAVAIGWLLLGVRRTAEDRGPGQPQRARPQEPPPSPAPRTSETPPSGATTPSAPSAPGAAASDAPPL